MSVFAASNKMMDCFGNEYKTVKMLPTGFCGYHALSYCLTGTQLSYGNIIEDCINVLTNVPDLFRIRTNFGARVNSSSTLSDYAAFMRDSVQRVQSGLPVHTDCWCEDAHFVAISLLYDIAICIYSTENKQWHVFNENATRGYICLLSSPGHFDVLDGINGTSPKIPTAADTHGVSRDRLHSDGWQCLQSDYPFQFVHKFPEHFAGIHILNNPVVLYESKPENVTVSCENHTAEQQTTVHKCEYPGCKYVGKNVQSLSLHKMRSHKKKRKCSDTDNMQSDSSSVTSVSFEKYPSKQQTTVGLHKCDYFGCSYVGKNTKSLSMHKMRCHKKNRKTNDTMHVSSVPRQQKPVHRCDFPGCNYAADKVRQLAMHKTKLHRSKTSSKDHSVDSSPQITGFSYSNVTERGFTMHSSCAQSQATAGSNLSPSLQQQNIQRHTHGDENESVLSVTTQNSVEQKVSSVMSDVEPDDTPFAGVEATCSETSAIIVPDKKKTITLEETESNVCNINQSDVEPVQRHAALNSDKYVCDIDGCGSQHATSRGLSIHKSKRHSSTLRVDDAVNVGLIQAEEVTSVKSDSLSDSTVYSTTSSVRRSVRIHNKKKRINATETESTVSQMNQSEVHSISHCVKTNTYHTNTFTYHGTNNWRQNKATNTRKDHLKTTFSAQIAETEKKFVPRTKPKEQTDHLYDKLKDYHDVLIQSVTNRTTEKISAEVVDVLVNPTVVDDCDRRFLWSTDDEERLNELNKKCKLIQPRADWTWGASDDSDQGKYNDLRMQLCLTKECDWKIIECDQCESTGLLVGHQTDSEVCYDCLKLKPVNKTERKHKEDAWEKIKPVSKEYPKTAGGQDLPHLQPGDKAVISPVHPVVTVQKNQYANKRLRIESISLAQDPVPTWCKVLPRTSLADRYMVIERRVQNAGKYIVANADRVRQWLRYPFLHHKEFIRLQRPVSYTHLTLPTIYSV